MSGILYVVATPLGNLEDLSGRAARILGEADLIACEDTRHTRRLLEHLGIRVPMVSYHEHNEAARTADLLNRLKDGKVIALVSDAGTPLLSDPGYRIVSECRTQSIPVIPVPGPSAVTAALSAAGLPTDRFLFLGFLSKRGSQRRAQLEEAAPLPATLVLFVSPHDLVPTLRDLLEVLGNRRVFVGRELTKMYESASFGLLEEVLADTKQLAPRGEYTLVIEGSTAQAKPAPGGVDVAAYVRGLMEIRGLSGKDAVRQAAADLGRPRREVYQLFTQHSRPGTPPEEGL